MQSLRIDKWLWATRIYKTRTLATKACTTGQVTMEGLPVKPARLLRAGDVVKARTDSHTRTVKVIALIEKRIGAPLVSLYLEELTTPEEKNQKPSESFSQRPRGSGRPTKRERRLWEKFEQW